MWGLSPGMRTEGIKIETFPSISTCNHEVQLEVAGSEYQDLIYFSAIILLGQKASREYGTK